MRIDPVKIDGPRTRTKIDHPGAMDASDIIGTDDTELSQPPVI